MTDGQTSEQKAIKGHGNASHRRRHPTQPPISGTEINPTAAEHRGNDKGRLNPPQRPQKITQPLRQGQSHRLRVSKLKHPGAKPCGVFLPREAVLQEAILQIEQMNIQHLRQKIAKVMPAKINQPISQQRQAQHPKPSDEQFWSPPQATAPRHRRCRRLSPLVFPRPLRASFPASHCEYQCASVRMPLFYRKSLPCAIIPPGTSCRPRTMAGREPRQARKGATVATLPCARPGRQGGHSLHHWSKPLRQNMNIGTLSS